MSDEATTNEAEAPGLTKEQVEAELQVRTEQFNTELLPLLGKYELGLGATAFINPSGTIGARPILFDARQKAAAEGEEAAEAAPDLASV